MTVPVYWVGDTGPSISDTLTSGGTAVDLSADTVTFNMRGPLDGIANTTIKINAAALAAHQADGYWQYDWAAGDLDTEGSYLCWLNDTTTGQTLWEILIEVRPHGVSRLYVEPEQIKDSLTLLGTSFADRDLELAAAAASRAIDGACGRRFWQDADTSAVQYYTPDGPELLIVDDVVSITEVAIDRSGTGDFTSETWTADVDYVLEPYNNPVTGRPYEQLRVRRTSGRWFPFGIEKSVRVTGQFGWSAIPEEIVAATSILAHKLVRRVREAPFGVLTVGVIGVDSQTAIRIARSDPDIANLIGDYVRTTPFV